MAQYLLLKRTSERGGFRQPATGGAEEGETRATALAREVLEETGTKDPVRIVGDVDCLGLPNPPNLMELCVWSRFCSQRELKLTAESTLSTVGAAFERPLDC